MKGIKKVSGLTRQYCDKDGYGMRIQGIYNPVEDKITGLLQFGGSYVVPRDDEISVWFNKPTTMAGVANAVEDRIEELELIHQYMEEVLEC